VIKGVHVLALVAIAMGAVSVRATEVYATRYQTLPVVDWLESRPPLAEAADLPAASTLARGLARALPLLTVRDDARPRLPSFGPPAFVQRTMGGVRDASRIELGSPGPFVPTEVPVRARLDVIVFNRAVRAAAWSDLMGREMDVRDPESNHPQARTAGPDELDGVWVVAPRAGGGVATVAGHRGAVAFALQVTFASPVSGGDVPDEVDLSARAEALARRASAEWTRWLAGELDKA
jgi:hypothetical protein